VWTPLGLFDSLMRTSTRAVLASVALTLACGATPNDARTRHASGPNVVLILADDLGSGDPRCFAPASLIPTPSIDRLQPVSVRVCAASRR
jgi:hypothetical protein